MHNFTRFNRGLPVAAGRQLQIPQCQHAHHLGVLQRGEAGRARILGQRGRVGGEGEPLRGVLGQQAEQVGVVEVVAVRTPGADPRFGQAPRGAVGRFAASERSAM